MITAGSKAEMKHDDYHFKRVSTLPGILERTAPMQSTWRRWAWNTAIMITIIAEAIHKWL